MPATAAYQVAEEHLLPGATGQNIRAPRFFVQMGFDEIRVDTDAVQFRGDDGAMIHRILPRARIVPCVTYAHRTNVNEIREGEKIDGSEEVDRDGRTTYARYYRYAFYEAERLLDIENGSSRKSGLVEITALSGLASVVYGRDGSINNLFYPSGLETLPETNAELIAYLESRLASLQSAKPAGVDDLHYSTVLMVGSQLINAARRADSIQRSRLQFTHTCMHLNSSDDLFKAEYDAVDEEMLRRTGVPRIHQADVMTAEALRTLAGQKNNPPQNGDIDTLRAEIAELKRTVNKRDEQLDALIGKIVGAETETSVQKTKK